jgi:CheY-like chemotaxis protein
VNEELRSSASLSSPSQKTILVIDDDDNVRGLIEMSATLEGFKVIAAYNGIDAQSKIEVTVPDLIITDLMMPGQGGYEFLRGLQAAGQGNIPVFVVTGTALDTSTIDLIRQEANVVEFVAKPLRMSQFLQMIHKHLKTTPQQKPNTATPNASPRQ